MFKIFILLFFCFVSTLSAQKMGYTPDIENFDGFDKNLEINDIQSSGTITGTHAGDGSGLYNLTFDTTIITIPVKNVSGKILERGRAVIITGATGDLAEINTADMFISGRHNFVGFVYSSSINNNAAGDVIIAGKFAGVNTTGRSEGGEVNLWVDGYHRDVKNSTGVVHVVGTYGRIHATQGIIFIHSHDAHVNTVATNEDFTQRLGDNDGSNRFIIQDFNGNTVGYITSDGYAVFEGSGNYKYVVWIASDVVVEGITFSDGSRQTTADGGVGFSVEEIFTPNEFALPSAPDYAIPIKIEGANKIYWVADCNENAPSTWTVTCKVNQDYNGGDVSFGVIWISSAATSGTGFFGINYGVCDGTDIWDIGLTNLPFTHTTVAGTAYQLNYSSETVTPTGWAANGVGTFQFYYDGVTSTMNGTARVLCCFVNYNE